MTALLDALMPEGVGPWVFAALVGVSFLGSFITVAFGIGGGGLVLAVLAALMPPAALIPVHGVVQLGSNAGRAVMLWRHIFRPALPGFVLGTIVGVAIGGMIVVDLPPAFVQIGVGVFIIWSVISKPPAWLKRWPWLTGGISSFLTMFFGATGLFVAGYTKSLALPRHDHVATHAALMTVQHGLKVVAFGVLGFAFAQWIGVIVAMVVAGGLGTLAGRSALNHMTDVNFRRILDVVLVLISLRLIWAGVTDLI